MDTRGWSQILVSVLTGISGLQRKKGQDLDDGSDVKGANAWESIDRVRFNGVLKAGTKANNSGKIESLDDVPFLFFVLWDIPTQREDNHRCRIWVVRPQSDLHFRAMAETWFGKNRRGEVSNNFQLHPPIGSDGNTFRNTCGNLIYPLLFSAEMRPGEPFKVTTNNSSAMDSGTCKLA